VLAHAAACSVASVSPLARERSARSRSTATAPMRPNLPAGWGGLPQGGRVLLGTCTKDATGRGRCGCEAGTTPCAPNTCCQPGERCVNDVCRQPTATNTPVTSLAGTCSAGPIRAPKTPKFYATPPRSAFATSTSAAVRSAPRTPTAAPAATASRLRRGPAAAGSRQPRVMVPARSRPEQASRPRDVPSPWDRPGRKLVLDTTQAAARVRALRGGPRACEDAA